MSELKPRWREIMYKCGDCGCSINEGEAKTFGVCDGCFEKNAKINKSGSTAGSATALRRIADDLIGIGQHIDEYLNGESETLPLVMDIQEQMEKFKNIKGGW